MLNDKELVLNVVRNMPETISFREIVNELSLLEQVTGQLTKKPEGAGVSPEDALKMLDAWTTKSSRPRL